jgi:hypothetical protein
MSDERCGALRKAQHVADTGMGGGEFDHEVGVTEERVGIFDKRTGCGRVEPEER